MNDLNLITEETNTILKFTELHGKQMVFDTSADLEKRKWIRKSRLSFPGIKDIPVEISILRSGSALFVSSKNTNPCQHRTLNQLTGKFLYFFHEKTRYVTVVDYLQYFVYGGRKNNSNKEFTHFCNDKNVFKFMNTLIFNLFQSTPCDEDFKKIEANGTNFNNMNIPSDFSIPTENEIDEILRNPELKALRVLCVALYNKNIPIDCFYMKYLLNMAMNTVVKSPSRLRYDPAVKSFCEDMGQLLSEKVQKLIQGFGCYHEVDLDGKKKEMPIEWELMNIMFPCKNTTRKGVTGWNGELGVRETRLDQFKMIGDALELSNQEESSTGGKNFTPVIMRFDATDTRPNFRIISTWDRMYGIACTSENVTGEYSISSMSEEQVQEMIEKLGYESLGTKIEGFQICFTNGILPLFVSVITIRSEKRDILLPNLINLFQAMKERDLVSIALVSDCYNMKVIKEACQWVEDNLSEECLGFLCATHGMKTSWVFHKTKHLLLPVKQKVFWLSTRDSIGVGNKGKGTEQNTILEIDSKNDLTYERLSLMCNLSSREEDCSDFFYHIVKKGGNMICRMFSGIKYVCEKKFRDHTEVTLSEGIFSESNIFTFDFSVHNVCEPARLEVISKPRKEGEKELLFVLEYFPKNTLFKKEGDEQDILKTSTYWNLWEGKIVRENDLIRVVDKDVTKKNISSTEQSRFSLSVFTSLVGPDVMTIAEIDLKMANCEVKITTTKTELSHCCRLVDLWKRVPSWSEILPRDVFVIDKVMSQRPPMKLCQMKRIKELEKFIRSTKEYHFAGELRALTIMHCIFFPLYNNEKVSDILEAYRYAYKYLVLNISTFKNFSRGELVSHCYTQDLLEGVALNHDSTKKLDKLQKAGKLLDVRPREFLNDAIERDWAQPKGGQKRDCVEMMFGLEKLNDQRISSFLPSSAHTFHYGKSGFANSRSDLKRGLEFKKKFRDKEKEQELKNIITLSKLKKRMKKLDTSKLENRKKLQKKLKKDVILGLKKSVYVRLKVREEDIQLMINENDKVFGHFSKYKFLRKTGEDQEESIEIKHEGLRLKVLKIKNFSIPRVIRTTKKYGILFTDTEFNSSSTPMNVVHASIISPFKFCSFETKVLRTYVPQRAYVHHGLTKLHLRTAPPHSEVSAAMIVYLEKAKEMFDVVLIGQHSDSFVDKKAIKSLVISPKKNPFQNILFFNTICLLKKKEIIPLKVQEEFVEYFIKNPNMATNDEERKYLEKTKKYKKMYFGLGCMALFLEFTIIQAKKKKELDSSFSLKKASVFMKETPKSHHDCVYDTLLTIHVVMSCLEYYGKINTSDENIVASVLMKLLNIKEEGGLRKMFEMKTRKVKMKKKKGKKKKGKKKAESKKKEEVVKKKVVKKKEKRETKKLVNSDSLVKRLEIDLESCDEDLGDLNEIDVL